MAEKKDQGFIERIGEFYVDELKSFGFWMIVINVISSIFGSFFNFIIPGYIKDKWTAAKIKKTVDDTIVFYKEYGRQCPRCHQWVPRKHKCSYCNLQDWSYDPWMDAYTRGDSALWNDPFFPEYGYKNSWTEEEREEWIFQQSLKGSSPEVRKMQIKLHEEVKEAKKKRASM